MGFWQRVGEFFGFGRAASTASAVEARLARGQRLYSRDQAAMLQAYSDHPHLHGVVRGRAEVAGSIAWEVFETKEGVRSDELGIAHLRDLEHRDAIVDLKKEGTLQPAYNSDLARLLRRPSPTMSGADFWGLMCEHEMLVGEYLMLKAARRGRRPTILHPLVPTWLQAWPEPGRDHFTILAPGGRIIAPPADVIWRKRLDPRDPHNGRGIGTAYVLRDELRLDELLAEMAASRAANKNFPDVLISLLRQQGEIGPGPGQAAIDVLTKTLEQKHGNGRVGQAHVMTGDFKAQVLGHTLVEGQYMETRRFNRDTAMQTFRQPPELAGVLDNANRSTINAAEDLEARRSIVPIYERWRSMVQDELADVDFGGRFVVGYRSPVPADTVREDGLMKALSSCFTKNEVRVAAGKPVRDDGDVYVPAPAAVPVAGSPSSPTGDEQPEKKKPKEKP